MGAVIGTIMVGNVFRIIMPAQRALVAAIAENRTPDAGIPSAKGTFIQLRCIITLAARVDGWIL